MKCYKIILTTTLLALSFNAMPKTYYYPKNKTKATPNILDLCIFLDLGKELKDFREKGKTKIVTQSLSDTIFKEEAIIASAPLIQTVLETSEGEKVNNTLLDKKKWASYKTKNGKFYVLIPKNKYEDINTKNFLKNLSLNKDALTKINSEKDLEVKKELQSPTSVDLKTFENIFLPKSKIKKRILLVGHGRKENIANIEIEKFNQFLTFLKKINCEFLYILSCYAAGVNILKAQMAVVKDLKEVIAQEKKGKKIDATIEKFKSIKTEIPFIIIVTSISDTKAEAPKITGINLFFKDLNEFLSKERTSEEWVYTKPFETILKNIAGEAIQNQPSIRFPGIPFFRAANLNKEVKIITYPFLLHHELKAKTKKKSKAIPIDTPYALIYPSIINVPLEFSRDELPKIMPMIAGKSHFFIKKIVTPDLQKYALKKYPDLEAFEEEEGIKKESFKMLIRSFGHQSDLSPRLFFIGELQGKKNKSEYKNIVIRIASKAYKTKKTEDYGKRKAACIYQKGDKFFYAIYNPDTEKEINFKAIKKSDAEQKINEWVKETEPLPEALYEATAGIETEKKFKKTLGDHLKKYKLNLKK